MLIHPASIAPSQDFLKVGTLRYIFDCLQSDMHDKLPPAPIVRRDTDGSIVAIDGHNLIAVRLFRGEQIGVIMATSPDPVLPEDSEANMQRNKDLAARFDAVLDDRRRVADEGIVSFTDLIDMYTAAFL